MSEINSESKKPSLISFEFSDVLGLGKAAEKLSPAAEKIVDGLGKCINPALGATKIYLEARARGAALRHETKKNLQQISEVDAILASDPQLAEAMKARLISTEMRRQENIHRAAQRAVEIANNIDSGEAQPLDQDFIQEWIEGVKDISNGDVQKIWAALLASAPTMPTGRISKPALELLKQMDQPTAICFIEFGKVWASVGFPSVKAPFNWEPFEAPIRLKLLQEIGIIERQTFVSLNIPYLGVITQIEKGNRKFSLINTLEVYVWGQRAMEIGGAIFKDPFDIDEESVHAARIENFAWLADDMHWSLGVAKTHSPGGKFDYEISPMREGLETANQAIAVLDVDGDLDASWKRVLRKYGEAGRLIIPV